MTKQSVFPYGLELGKGASNRSPAAISMDISLLKRVQQIAEEAFPYECCGFLAGRLANSSFRVSQVIAAVDSQLSLSRYFISAATFRSIESELQRRDLEIVGFFHSHPDAPAQPSETDLQNAWPWFSYLIVSLRAGKAKEVRSWQLRDDRSRFQSQRLLITEKDEK